MKNLKKTEKQYTYYVRLHQDGSKYFTSFMQLKIKDCDLKS